MGWDLATREEEELVEATETSQWRDMHHLAVDGSAIGSISSVALLQDSWVSILKLSGHPR